MGFLSKAWKKVRKVIGVIVKPIGKLLKKWLQPKLPDKEGLKIQRKGSDIFIPTVYGRREVGAIVVDTNVTDASGGAENEFLHVLAVFSYGEIDAFEEFFFNGISENDPRWRKDKNNPNSGKWFTKEVRTGTLGQTAVNAVGKLNRFDPLNSRYEGIAHVFFTFQQDSEQSIWNGEPEITVVMRGKKCFDPRTNQTQYTENGAIHLLDYVKSPIYGKGLTDSEINITSFVNVANICDTNETATVDTQVCQTVNGVYTCTGSPAQSVTFKRFSNNTIIDTEKTVFDNMVEIAESFRGFFPEGNGLINIACEKEESPVYHFDASNILSNITSSQPGRNDRYNRVIVRFPNSANKFQMDEVVFPDSEDPLYQQWLEEDNFLPQDLVITAEYCVYKALALQLAEVAAKVSRNAETVTFSSDTRATELDVGDVFTITEETRGWDNRTFRVSDISYRDDGYVDITGIQHENGVYPWSEVSYTEIVGGSNLGDPTNIPAPTALTITPDPTFSTSGTLTWQSVNNAFIRRYEISVFQGSTLVYRTETLGKLWSIPLFHANSYSISVRAVSTLGTLSPAASIAFELTQPQAPIDIDFTISNFEIEARPVLLGAGLGTTFEFAIDSIDVIRGRGVSLVFTGLKHGTEYEIFARTVNALGVSAWFSKTAVTTSESADIIDLIGEDINTSIFQPIVDQLQNDFQQVTDSINQDVADLNTEVGLLETDLSNFKEVAFENERELKLRISREEASRIESDKQLFNTTAEAVRLRNITSEIRGAVFDIDPESGTITLKAFNYADSKFAEAAVLIDGVNASVAIQANWITNTEQRITQAESELIVQAGQISLKASFTDVNEAIAGAIDAILPAYSFGFFNSAEGWSAVNGTLTPATSKINLAWGDIENTSLSYVADENPLISISIERTGGSGWAGNIIVTFNDNSTQTYTGVIEDIPTGGVFVRNLNLDGESTYTGDVTGIRLVLGASVADTFTVNSITIGKPSATLVELEGITAQVNSLGIEMDAVNASLVNYVTTAFYSANTVTLNNVETVLDGTEAIISLRATQTFINDQDTIEKANAAAIWVDAAEANITSVVESFNAQPGGVDDQLGAISETFTIVQNEIDAVEGLARTQAVSINRIKNSSDQQGKEQLQSEYELYLAKRNLLEVGTSIATAEFSIQALAEADQALAQSILDLNSSTGTQLGQLNANLQQVNTTLTNQISAVSQSVTDLSVSLGNEIDAAVQRLDQAELDINGNASAITTVQGVVNNPTTGLSATFTLAQAAKTTADGNTNSLTLLSNQVDNLDQDITSTAQLAQQTAILADDTASSLTTLTNTVNNASTGLSATNTLAQQAKTTADGNASSISTLQGAINNPTNGLSATFTLAQAAKTASDGNTSSITTINNTINNGTTGLSATFTLATTANNRSQANQTAIAGLQTQVNNIDGDLAQAELLLQSTVNELGQVSARAFLGVTTVTAGRAVINGIVVDGATNSLEFRANTLRLTDTAGNSRLYWDSVNNTWIFNGRLIVGGYAVNSEADIRALDGKTFETRYSTSSTTPTGTNPAGWTIAPPNTTNPIFSSRVTRLSNGNTEGSWSTPVRWNGLQGASGTNARVIALFATKQAVTYRTDGSRDTDSIAFNTSTQSLSGGIYEFQLQCFRTDGTFSPATATSDGSLTNPNLTISGGSATLNTSSSYSVFNPNNEFVYYRMRVRYLVGGVPQAEDVVSIGKVYDGSVGAGFYGSTYDAISWTTLTANSRFQSLVGRAPVNLDIFTQTRTDGTDSQARQYNGSTWAAVALQVNGSIVARGSIAGDRFIAGTEISGPIITGPLIRTAPSGMRTEIQDDGTYLQWAGSGAKTDANSIFHIKKNGDAFYAGDLRDGASSSSGYSILTNPLNLTRNVETTVATVVIPSIAGKVISIQAIVNGMTYGAFGTGQTYSTVIRIRRNGTLVASKTQPGVFSDYEVVRLFLDNPGAGTFTYTLTVQCNVTDGDHPAGETINVKYAALATQQLRR